MKNEKGITLIALVITIIVMLILVTVTIRVATSGNLFTHAANAVKGTKSAIADEDNILNDNLDKSIEEIVAEQTGEGRGAATTYTAYDVGDTITIAEQDFYVIENSDASTSTVKLLAAQNVDTTTNKQSASAGTVAFDSTEPYTNDYSSNSCTIRELVNTYVASLGVSGAEGRLMLLDEAEALQDGYTDILYASNFWLGSPRIENSDYIRAYTVNGGARGAIDYSQVDGVGNYGLRPLIIVPKANIPAQD